MFDWFYNWFVWIRSVLSGFLDGVEATISPGIKTISPFIRFMSSINIYVVATLFVLILLYMIFVRKHRILDKLSNPRNYFALLLMFGIYMFFAKTDGINLGSGYAIQFQTVVLPMVTKLLGPILGGFVAMILYMASFWLGKAAFNINMIFISGISGMLYGWVLYKYPTSFWRCLVSKILVTVVCNIFLYPWMQGALGLPEYLDLAAENMAFGITQNVIMIPIHAVLIYVELVIMRYIREYLADSAWSLEN